MNEPMSDERLAEIRTAVEGYRGTSLIRLRPGSAHAHREALLAECDRLRAQLAAADTEQAEYAARIGAVRVEWATRDAYGVDERHLHETEADAFAACYPGESVVRRIASDWIAVGGRLAADADATAPSATHAAPEAAPVSVDGNSSSITPAGQTGPHAPCSRCAADMPATGGHAHMGRSRANGITIYNSHGGRLEDCPEPDCIDDAGQDTTKENRHG